MVMELGPAALHRPVPAQLNHDMEHCFLNVQLSPCQYPRIYPCIRTVYLKKGSEILFGTASISSAMVVMHRTKFPADTGAISQ